MEGLPSRLLEWIITNLIVLDNTNTTVDPLPDGVLASTYSYSDACDPYNKPAFKLGFDILIHNSGVSLGTNNFTLGPCPPATNIQQLDFETILLHELGHALNLGHIIDSYEGTQLPFVNPPILMNFAFPNGVKRVSPDISAKTGADYNIKPLGVDFW
jgi:hypothetical protein